MMEMLDLLHKVLMGTKSLTQGFFYRLSLVRLFLLFFNLTIIRNLCRTKLKWKREDKVSELWCHVESLEKRVHVACGSLVVQANKVRYLSSLWWKIQMTGTMLWSSIVIGRHRSPTFFILEVCYLIWVLKHIAKYSECICHFRLFCKICQFNNIFVNLVNLSNY